MSPLSTSLAAPRKGAPVRMVSMVQMMPSRRLASRGRLLSRGVLALVTAVALTTAGGPAVAGSAEEPTDPLASPGLLAGRCGRRAP